MIKFNIPSKTIEVKTVLSYYSGTKEANIVFVDKNGGTSFPLTKEEYNALNAIIKKGHGIVRNLPNSNFGDDININYDDIKS